MVGIKSLFSEEKLETMHYDGYDDHFMMVINKDLKSKKRFLCLQIFRNFISLARKSRSLKILMLF